MECNFCKKKFTTKSNLETHQKKTLYCLKIQGKEEGVSFKCDYCEKIFTSRQNHTEHSCKKREEEKYQKIQDETICKVYESKLAEKDRYIADLKSTIEELKQKIEKFENALISSSKTTTTNNTTNHNNIVINHSLDLSREKVEKMIEHHLTPKVIGQGQVGLALMTYEHLLKDENGNPTYKCVDPARQIFEYVNKDGDVVKDVKANKLIGALVDSTILGKKTRENAEKLWTDENGNIDNERFNTFVMKSTEITNLESENSKFRSTLTSKTS